MTGGQRMRAPQVEPQDMYNHVAQLSADQQLSIVAAVPGRLDPALLERAAAALLAAEPVLGCRYVEHPRRPRFEPFDAADVAKPLVRDAADPRAAAFEWAAVPVDPCAAPPFAVALFRGPATDVLGLRVHHVVTDGQGAKEVAYRFAETYSALARGERPAPARAGSRSGLQVLRRFDPVTLVSAAYQADAGRPTWGVPSVGEPGQRRFEVRTLSPERFGALRAYGKARGATVNDLVVTAVVRALFDALEAPTDRPMLLNVSFDLRRYLPAPPSAAALNLSSIETLAVTRVPGEPFADTLRGVSSRLAELKAGKPGLRGAVLMELMGRLGGYGLLMKAGGEPMLRGRQHGVSFPFVSNFGVLDPARLRLGPLEPAEAVVLPPSSLPPFVMVGVSTWHDRLSLVVGYPPDAMPEGFAARLLDAARDELESVDAEAEAV
jgi:NRPS condensation-like uncharacterized protein